MVRASRRAEAVFGGVHANYMEFPRDYSCKLQYINYSYVYYLL